MKNLKRLLCLLLCLITVTCCGCLERRQEEIKKNNEKRELMAFQKEKELSASFVPDVAGYKLEVKSVLEFEDEKDRQAQGFLSFDHFKRGYNGDYGIYASWNNESFSIKLKNKFNGTEYVGCEEKKIVCPLSQITAWDHFLFRHGGNTSDSYYKKFIPYALYDGENYFLIAEHTKFSLSEDRITKSYIESPIALYILDFENQKVLYCDYAEEYYDYCENLNTKYNPFCFKITKV